MATQKKTRRAIVTLELETQATISSIRGRFSKGDRLRFPERGLTYVAVVRQVQVNVIRAKA